VFSKWHVKEENSLSVSLLYLNMFRDFTATVFPNKREFEEEID